MPTEVMKLSYIAHTSEEENIFHVCLHTSRQESLGDLPIDNTQAHTGLLGWIGKFCRCTFLIHEMRRDGNRDRPAIPARINLDPDMRYCGLNKCECGPAYLVSGTKSKGS